MSTPELLDRERIFDFIILMLYLHYQVPGGPEPNPEWKPLYYHISNFFNHSWDKSIDEVRCKNLWVRIIKDYCNPDRGTVAWLHNKPAQEPWNDNMAPLAAYTDFFDEDQEGKKQRIAKVQRDFEGYWGSNWGSKYNDGQSDESIAEKQKVLHDIALTQMKQVKGFERAATTAMNEWPAEAAKDHFL
ncbi:MAG: hypothetical protein Q9174_001243 [Haloplaca sp. 1 TL-2023]